MTIGQLNVALGLLVNKSEWKQGEAYINHFRRIALTFGAVFGGRVLGKALIGFNAQVETSKNQIAAMLAFGKQSSIAAELTNANTLYDNLRKKAAELPGETQDYVNMLGMITQPLAAAGASLKDMETFTVNSFVLSKGIGEGWQKSARDIREFINFGKINMVDTFTRTLMKPLGYDADDKSRAKLKKMTAKERMELMKSALEAPQIKQMIDLQANSFTGRVDAVKDALKQAMGKAGEGLFNSLKTSMAALAKWLTDNKARIEGWATAVGTAIASAFEGLQNGIRWLLDHRTVLDAFLFALGGQLLFISIRAIGAWMAIAWPMFAGAGIFMVFAKLTKYLGPIPAILGAIGLAAGLMWLGLGGPIPIILGLITAVAGVLYELGVSIKEVFQAISDFFSFGVMDIDVGGGMTVGDMVAKKEAESGGGPVRQMSAAEISAGAAASTNITVGETMVTINTQDVEGAKKAFSNVKESQFDHMLRAAHKNGGGK